MFVQFRFLRGKARKRKEHESEGLMLENSNLEPEQIATAQKALRILGLETRLDELTKQDFIVFLYAMGLNPTEDIIDSKIRSFKLHHQKTFTFGQLAHVWYSMLQDLTDEDEILKRAFQFFDKDGNGEISVQELRTTMHELGDLLTDEEINSFMEIMDVNNDGAIGYTEFLATLKTQAPNLSGNGGKGAAGATTREEPQDRRQEAACEGAAVTTSLNGTGSSPTPTCEPLPLNVPRTSDRRPAGATGQGAAAVVSPFACAAAAGSTGGGEGGRPGGTGDGLQGSGLMERIPGLAERSIPSAARGISTSSLQLPTFPARRQLSLKAGPSSQPPSAVVEPLIQADSPTALTRPGSRRLDQPVSVSRVASGSGPVHHSILKASGSLRRGDDSSLPGAGIVSGDDVDSGQGLRAPSKLDPGSGSDGA